MNNFGSNIAGGLLVFAVVAVIIFLVFREVFCWYWKINQNVALLTEIRDLLSAKGNSQAEVDAGHTFVSAKNTTSPSGYAAQVPQKESLLRCPGCGATVVDAGSPFCTQCGSKI